MKLTPKSASLIQCVVIKPRERDLSFSEDIFLSLAEVNSDHLRPKYYHFTKYTVMELRKQGCFPNSVLFPPTLTKAHFPSSLPPHSSCTFCHHQARINIGCQVRSTWAFTHNPGEL